MAHNLSTKLIRTGTALLLVALASIGLTLWVTWQLEGGAAAVNEAGRLRMQTWRLASAVQAQVPPHDLQQGVQQLDRSLLLLRDGDATRPLFVPWEAEVAARFADVEALWAAQRPRWLQPAPDTHHGVQQEAEQFVYTVDALVLAIETQLAGLTAVLNLFQFVMMALAIGAAVVMVYTGYLYVINPLAQVHKGLQRVESGDFATRIDVDTNDEFGQVAAGFNRMTQTLEALYAGLEAQVEAKTRDIEAQRRRLQTLYDVSAFLSQANTLEGMSQGFAQRVRQFMRADAVALRWCDEANQRYLMLATDCFPQELAQQEQSLATGVCSCGSVSGPARARVIPIQSLDNAASRACARVGYRTLVSVPVVFQTRVLGEMDVFFREDITLSREETDLLDALGAHLASALESLRAAALEREAAVGEERSLLARELHDSIAQSLAFLKIQTQLLRGALQRGQPAQAHQTLDELDQGLKESIADVRELLVHFRTRPRGDDILGALQETLQKFQHQTQLPARLDWRGEGLPLPADVQVQVLHILQEALSNVRKHARATSVVLAVRQGRPWVFEVMDDGSGFDTQAHKGESHVGLKIMRERAERIGAQVAVDSEPGQGTRVRLTLPERPAAERSTSAPDPVSASPA